jgi:AGZA family xanthine/uracil permease-like MFS transporter
VASVYLWIAAVFTFFGIIHSAVPDGNLYLPWHLAGMARQIPYQFTVAYVILALLLLVLASTKESAHPPPAEAERNA